MFPCNCRPPFPRPEPFSPLPRPGTVPDWGKWIRDHLAEKGALLAFPTRTAFPSAGDAPSLYLAEDTGVVYRWGEEGYAVLVDPSASDVETYPARSAFPDTGRTGVIYIDASANLLYRWNGTGYVLLTTDLSGVESRLAGVESKVPAQATAQNQLADKAFVNSSIATNTAFYITDNGRPFQSLADLENYEGALTNNDYAFVVGRDAAGNTTYTRYKWNEATEAWGEEYVLNNSSFTAEQWAAISSGITSGLVAKLGALPTAEALAQALAGKQDALTFDNAPTAGSNNPVKSSGIWSAIWGALSALPAGFSSLYDWVVAQLAGKASKADATLTERGPKRDGFSAWTYSANAPDGYHWALVFVDETNPDAFGWHLLEVEDSTGSDVEVASDLGVGKDALRLNFSAIGITATRTALPGYQLGSQTTKPVASEAEAEALRNGKLDKSSEAWNVSYTEDGLHIADTAGVYYIDISPGGIKTNYPDAHNVYWPDTGGTLALLENLTGKFSSSTAYAKDALVVYLGALYRCVNPNGHIGAWVAADFTVATVEDVLAALRTGKADKPATFTAGNIAVLDPAGNPTDSGLSKGDVEGLFFAQYYPDGSVNSAAEFTAGIKYDDPDPANRTITVKPFCNTGTAENDNSGLVGRVVIPPFVDAQGNGYISDDGTRYKVVGVSNGNIGGTNTNLTAIVAPSTMITVGDEAFSGCLSLSTVSLFAATTIGGAAFNDCSKLASISLPSVVTIGDYAFRNCAALTSVDFGDTPRSSVPLIYANAFSDVPRTCKIIVPDAQYDEWIVASGWSDLVTAGYKFLRHSEWEYARKYEVDKKADKPATFTAGNLAALDANGNPTDSQIPAANVALKSAIPYTLGTPIVIGTASSEEVGGETVNYGAATLADRTANVVQVTAPLDELRITFPAEASGKAQDFGLRVEIGTGSAALAAPALVPIAPTGETIKIENNAAEIPALADGTATAKGVTLLYFSETAPGVFVVKGEQVEEVA